jgi:DNA-binding response OmpR family regulator
MISKKQLELYGGGKKILVVDDDEFTQNQIKEHFGNIFGEIVFCEDGKTGIKTYIDSRDFDLVIVDINIGEIDGIKLSKQIKEVNRDQKLMILSSMTNTESFIELIDIGIDSFILKPFNYDKIARKVINILESSYYIQLLHEMRKEEIILEYKKNTDVSEESDENDSIQVDTPVEEKEVKIEKTKSSYSHLTSKVSSQKSAKEMFCELEADKEHWDTHQERIKVIITHTTLLQQSIHELLMSAENSYYNINLDSVQKNVEDISKLFSNVSNSLSKVSQLKPMAESFDDFSKFFADYSHLNNLDQEEVKELMSIDFILNDIKFFVDTVFIDRNSDNIYLYPDLFEQDLVQLESNIQNVNRDTDDGELDFF